MNLKSIIATTAVLLIAGAPGEAESNNGIDTGEFDYYEVHDYIECLGEGIEHELTITTRTHMVERGNGDVHQVINWFIEGYSFGLDSGLTWYTQHAPSPWVINTREAKTAQGWNLQIVWKPIDGGRQFHETWRLRFVTDANGAVRVFYDSDVQFHCVGRGG